MAIANVDFSISLLDNWNWNHNKEEWDMVKKKSYHLPLSYFFHTDGTGKCLCANRFQRSELLYEADDCRAVRESKMNMKKDFKLLRYDFKNKITNENLKMVFYCELAVEMFLSEFGPMPWKIRYEKYPERISVIYTYKGKNGGDVPMTVYYKAKTDKIIVLGEKMMTSYFNERFKDWKEIRGDEDHYQEFEKEIRSEIPELNYKNIKETDIWKLVNTEGIVDEFFGFSKKKS